MSFDVAELFTDSVRRAMPSALRKKLRVSFDLHGPRVTATGDAAALSEGVARLCTALIELVDAGFLVFHAHAQAHRPGKCLLRVRAAGTGRVAPAHIVEAVLRRLEMVDELGGVTRLRRAVGTCPYTGAPVEFASQPLEGVLFSAEWTLSIDRLAPPAMLLMPAHAWVIHDDTVVAEALMRRLQRLGWSTVLFDGPLPAHRRLRAIDGQRVQPALIIAIEGATVSPASVQCLGPWARGARLVYATCADSPLCGDDDAVPGFELHTQPFAPAALERFGHGVPEPQRRVAGM